MVDSELEAVVILSSTIIASWVKATPPRRGINGNLCPERTGLLALITYQRCETCSFFEYIYYVN